MRQHSPTAWRIASLYSSVLASETRDLAAHIDAAIIRERERCAEIAEKTTVSSNGHPQIDAPTPGDMRAAIVKAIREPLPAHGF